MPKLYVKKLPCGNTIEMRDFVVSKVKGTDAQFEEIGEI
jgi:hypothetical protein